MPELHTTYPNIDEPDDLDALFGMPLPTGIGLGDFEEARLFDTTLTKEEFLSHCLNNKDSADSIVATANAIDMPSGLTGVLNNLNDEMIETLKRLPAIYESDPGFARMLAADMIMRTVEQPAADKKDTMPAKIDAFADMYRNDRDAIWKAADQLVFEELFNPSPAASQSSETPTESKQLVLEGLEILRSVKEQSMQVGTAVVEIVKMQAQLAPEQLSLKLDEVRAQIGASVEKLDLEAKLNMAFDAAKEFLEDPKKRAIAGIAAGALLLGTVNPTFEDTSKKGESVESNTDNSQKDFLGFLPDGSKVVLPTAYTPSVIRIQSPEITSGIDIQQKSDNVLRILKPELHADAEVIRQLVESFEDDDWTDIKRAREVPPAPAPAPVPSKPEKIELEKVIPPQFADTVEEAAKKYGLPPLLLAGQLKQESNFNPSAVSHAGAEGIAQFMPGTAKLYIKDADNDGVSSPLDPEDAIDAQGRLMKALIQDVEKYKSQGRLKGDTTEAALTAYNWGPARLLAFGEVPSEEDIGKPYKYRGGTARVPREAAEYDLRIQRHIAAMEQALTDSKPEPSVAGEVLLKPVDGPITSDFGHRPVPVKGASSNHEGIDFRAPLGTDVRTSQDGRVIYTGYNPRGGNIIKIDHGLDSEGRRISTGYAHLSEIDVKVGQKVEIGQNVGKSGESGIVKGPHLHLSARVDGKLVNPKTLMNPDKKL